MKSLLHTLLATSAPLLAMVAPLNQVLFMGLHTTAPIVVTSLGTAFNAAGATLTLAITVPAGAAIIVSASEYNVTTGGTLSNTTNGAYTAVKTQSDVVTQLTAFVFLNSAAL